MQRIFIIVGLLFLLSGFQNCQPARTSASDSALSKAELTEVVSNDPEDEAEGEIAQPDDPGAPVDVENPGRPGNGNGNGNSSSNSDKDASGLYVCILEGPGKSVKLGVTDAGVPQGQNPRPGVLCMSKNACLNIASQAFGVKGPEFRGYCKLPIRPHVTHITDAQMQVKVDEYKKANP